MKQKMAILLSGLHYFENYKGSTVDFRNYVKNIKIKIYNYFNTKYEIDTFICTNSSILLNDLLKTYNPVQYIIEDHGNLIIKKIKGLQIIQNYSHHKNKKYDIILLTRFDIYFMKEFTNDNLNLNKLNIVSILESNKVCDDNLFILPNKYLKNFTQLIFQSSLHSTESNLIHYLKNKFERLFEVHYICNEYKLVRELSFFKLRFFENIQFILNEYLFSDNVVYKSIHNTSELFIQNDIIEYRKNDISMIPCPFSWIGYKISEKGYYDLSFEILSDRDIVDFPFIKLHNPVTYYNIPNICANVWTHVNTIIEVNECNDLLCFIFDEWKDYINIKYKNIVWNRNSMVINKMNIVDNHVYKLNKFNFKKLEHNTYEIIKEKTYSTLPYIWCGYLIKPENKQITMNFDILFLSDVPRESFFIKTHDPIQYYNEWLNHCKKDEFVSIQITFNVSINEQLIIFIMDEYYDSSHFIIRNISFNL